MRRFLMISPFFVPMNYVGAKRALHFCRHLPKHGWTPAVVALPEDLEKDPALTHLVPDVPLLRNLAPPPRAPRSGTPSHPSAKAPKPEPGLVGRALSGLRGLVAPLDRYTPHLPKALPGVLAFARAQRCELVYASGGPFSALLLADVVGRLLGLPTVLDLRDPWSLEPNYRADWTPGGARVVEALEAAWFKRASRVILNTQSAYEAHVQAYELLLPRERFTYLRNQFDPELYGPPGPPPSLSDPFRIIYYGHLRPTKNAQLFLKALARVIERRGIKPGALEFISLGDVTPEDEATIAALGLAGFVRREGWLPFTESPTLLGTADLLLDLMGPKHELQISGKLYDYLAAGRPILSISPNRELDDLFARTQAGVRVDVNEAAIEAALERALDRSGEPFTPNAAEVARLTAAPAAERLAQIFDDSVGRPQ